MLPRPGGYLILAAGRSVTFGPWRLIPKFVSQGSITMALDPRGAALALHRFGFGPKAGSIAALAPDPLGALLADLDAPNAGQIANADLPSSGAEARSLFENNAE